MARQQLGWLECLMPSRQADAAGVAQIATTANINAVPFLPQSMMYGPQVQN
jgi:hypothetical protein